MKKTDRPFLVALLLGSAAVAHGERVRMDRVPQAVRDSIRAQVGAATIEDLDFRTRNGLATYEVTYRKGGQSATVSFDTNGKILQNGLPGATAITKIVPFAQLPEAVQQVARTRAGTALINTAMEELHDGTATYKVGFVANGQQQEILLSQDGRILGDLPPSSVVSPFAAGSSVPVQIGQGSSEYANLVAPVVFVNSERISVVDLPPSVQAVVNREVGTVTIDDVRRGSWNEKPIYQVSFRPAGSSTVTLQIDPAGNIVFDPRTHASTTLGTDLTARAQALYPALQKAVPLTAAQTARIVDLPEEVQSAIRKQLGAAMVDSVQWGIWNGQRIYQAGFNWNGEHAQLQLDDYGNIVFDPRTELKK
jgi:uncharacterized membrane protein YkoI